MPLSFFRSPLSSTFIFLFVIIIINNNISTSSPFTFSFLTAYSAVIHLEVFSLSLRICLFISFMDLDVLMGGRDPEREKGGGGMPLEDGFSLLFPLSLPLSFHPLPRRNRLSCRVMKEDGTREKNGESLKGGKENNNNKGEERGVKKKLRKIILSRSFSPSPLRSGARPLQGEFIY